MARNVRTRRRKLPGPTLVFRNTRSGLTDGRGLPSPNQVTTYSPISVPGKQMTVSEGHEWPPVKGSRLTDRGGDFFTSRSYFVPHTVNYTVLKHFESGTSGPLQTFDGSLVPAVPTLASGSAAVDALFPPSAARSNAELNGMGATAIARCKPGDPMLSLSTSLAELIREGIPTILGQSIWQARTLSALRKGIGSEFLNYQFGYRPIVSDILKFGDIVSRTGELLKQYERDAGRVVRRQYSFPIERTSTEVQVYDSVYPLYISGLPGFGQYPHAESMIGKVVKRSDTFRRVWFSGAFTYYLPSDYHSRNRLVELSEKANVLLGTKLTPETIWNLTPWSWAADWFGSTGDVLSNLTSFQTNGLVMHYGYVMEQSIATHTYSHVYRGNQATPARVCEASFVTEVKQRREANPFGFGITWDGLSSSQKAIAVALGISRK